MTNTTPAKPVEKRFYIVDDAKGQKRLINAASPAAAVIHVFKPNVKAAKANEIPALLASGVKVEETA